MRYYISDLHYFHKNLNDQLDMRGFQNMEDMHRYMISKWNGKVQAKDEVVILGDFSVGRGKETNEIMEQLNGRLYLVRGNHDKFLKDKEFDSSRFEWIADYKELSDNKRKVILSHYPIFCYNGQYRRDGEGNPKVYMLYGHVHNTYDEILVNRFQKETKEAKRQIWRENEPREIPCQMINCFCMFSDYEPLSLDEWIEVDARRRAEME